MQCNDMSPEPCSFDVSEPHFECHEIHIVQWERQDLVGQILHVAAPSGDVSEPVVVSSPNVSESKVTSEAVVQLAPAPQCVEPSVHEEPDGDGAPLVSVLDPPADIPHVSVTPLVPAPLDPVGEVPGCDLPIGHGDPVLPGSHPCARAPLSGPDESTRSMVPGSPGPSGTSLRRAVSGCILPVSDPQTTFPVFDLPVKPLTTTVHTSATPLPEPAYVTPTAKPSATPITKPSVTPSGTPMAPVAAPDTGVPASVPSTTINPACLCREDRLKQIRERIDRRRAGRTAVTSNVRVKVPLQSVNPSVIGSSTVGYGATQAAHDITNTQRRLPQSIPPLVPLPSLAPSQGKTFASYKPTLNDYDTDVSYESYKAYSSVGAVGAKKRKPRQPTKVAAAKAKVPSTSHAEVSLSPKKSVTFGNPICVAKASQKTKKGKTKTTKGKGKKQQPKEGKQLTSPPVDGKQAAPALGNDTHGGDQTADMLEELCASLNIPLQDANSVPKSMPCPDNLHASTATSLQLDMPTIEGSTLDSNLNISGSNVNTADTTQSSLLSDDVFGFDLSADLDLSFDVNDFQGLLMD